MHLETVASKAFRIFIGSYPLFKGRISSANINLTLHKSLIGSVMIRVPRVICGRHMFFQIAAPAKHGSSYH